MKFIKINTKNTQEIYQIYNSYISSFPEDERRNELQFQNLFNNDKVDVFYITKNEIGIGYIILWNLSDFVFLEHFEIFQEFRNQGLGGLILEHLTKKKSKIILEAEPEFQDKTAERRVAFYLRNNFKIMDKNYIQPPYSPDKKALNLWLFSNFEITNISDIIYEIHNIIYQQISE